MLRYIIRRLLMLIPVLVGVAFVIFLLLYLTPGDPARIILGTQATPETIKALRTEMGLDDSFVVQFGRYLFKAFFRGDLGRTYVTKAPVSEEIKAAFPQTLKLAFWSVLLLTIVGIPVGVISAIKQYSWLDNIVMLLAMIATAMPVFWLGLLLILFFSVQLGWFPSSGFGSPMSMVLPCVAVATPSMAVVVRMTRSSMLEVIRQDYIRTARAKGQKESVVIFRHALTNALIPIVTIVGLQFGVALGGAVLTESVFSIHGVGRLMVDGIKMRDYPLVQGGVLYTAFAFSIVNLFVDILYAFIDPRIKAQYRQAGGRKGAKIFR
ncbi:MAG: ABC transporter permease [Synergistaceae bacterium]|jgi:peptide/nickel transport system permease protein|nr:ABC transporter permease [Synergistaceae bacterium]